MDLLDKFSKLPLINSHHEKLEISSYTRFTTDSSITIPNLVTFGFTLGSGNMYTWVVGKTMDINSVDDYSSQYFDLNPSVVSTSVSTVFTFTSK